MKSINKKLLVITAILVIICLPACSATVTKLNLENTITAAKTEYLTSFFNIDNTEKPLSFTALASSTDGSLRYALTDPFGIMVYGGTLNEGQSLDETMPLPPLKGNYIFNLNLIDFSGEYNFTINQ